VPAAVCPVVVVLLALPNALEGFDPKPDCVGCPNGVDVRCSKALVEEGGFPAGVPNADCCCCCCVVDEDCCAVFGVDGLFCADRGVDWPNVKAGFGLFGSGC
jgi:hypothetical protein